MIFFQRIYCCYAYVVDVAAAVVAVAVVDVSVPTLSPNLRDQNITLVKIVVNECSYY